MISSCKSYTNNNDHHPQYEIDSSTELYTNSIKKTPFKDYKFFPQSLYSQFTYELSDLKRDKYFISKLIQGCLDQDEIGQHTISSCIAKNNKIIVGPCFNNYNKAHPLSYSKIPIGRKPIHAEVATLIEYRKLNYKHIKRATLYIAGTTPNKRNVVKSSLPCKACLRLIKEVGIQKIVFLHRKKNVASKHDKMLEEKDYNIFVMKPIT